MELFLDWYRRLGDPDRPWLILGKGPSFNQRHAFDLEPYHLLALNHTGESSVSGSCT